MFSSFSCLLVPYGALQTSHDTRLSSTVVPAADFLLGKAATTVGYGCRSASTVWICHKILGKNTWPQERPAGCPA